MLTLSSKVFRDCAVLLSVAIGSTFERPLYAADHKVDFAAVAKETVKMRKDGDSMVMVMWLPPEYFAASLEGNPRLTADGKSSAVNTLRPYTIIAVVDAKVGAFGSMTFKSNEDIRSVTHVIDGK